MQERLTDGTKKYDNDQQFFLILENLRLFLNREILFNTTDVLKLVKVLKYFKYRLASERRKRNVS